MSTQTENPGIFISAAKLFDGVPHRKGNITKRYILQLAAFEADIPWWCAKIKIMPSGVIVFDKREKGKVIS